MTDPTSDRFYISGTDVRDSRDGHIVQAFTTSDLAQFYADTLNRLWKEGRIK